MIDKCAAGYQEFPRAVEAESPWRTMDSAPRDGVFLLINLFNNEIFLARVLHEERLAFLMQMANLTGGLYQKCRVEKDATYAKWHPMPTPPEIKS